MLRKLGIVRSETKGYQTFNKYIEPDFLSNKMMPSEYVRYCWQKYRDCDVPKNNSLNGAVFELIISSLFVKENILPLFLHAQVAFVPNISFDAVFYDALSGPVCISVKTSLRERYKQFDLEASALKQVHRKSECVIFTMDSEEAETVTKKISTGDVIAVDRAIYTESDELDKYFETLRQRPFVDPGKINIINPSEYINIAAVKDCREPDIKDRQITVE